MQLTYIAQFKMMTLFMSNNRVVKRSPYKPDALSIWSLAHVGWYENATFLDSGHDLLAKMELSLDETQSIVRCSLRFSVIPRFSTFSRACAVLVKSM